MIWTSLFASLWLGFALDVEPQPAGQSAVEGCVLPLNACDAITPVAAAQDFPGLLRADAALDRDETAPTIESDVFSTHTPAFAVPASASVPWSPNWWLRWPSGDR